ncbi:MAG TPA: hypothetical protein VEI97_03060, partial [bacterium]|nr:hypothetical protein [bacterium]
ALPLCRPVDLQAYYLCKTLGHVGYRLVVFSIPVLAAAFLFFELRGPAPGALPWFLVSLVGAFGLLFLINYTMGLGAFFFEWNYGIVLMKETLGRTMGGLLIPLTLFPEATRTILLWTPFPYLYYVPVRAYLGDLPFSELQGLLAVQYGWILALLLLSRLLTRSALRTADIQGG